MENQVSFNTFYYSWHDTMAELTDEQYGRLSRALNEYCFFGKMPELTGIEKTIFKMAIPNINASNIAKINGKKGGKNKAPLKAPLPSQLPSPLSKNDQAPYLSNGDGEGEGNGDVNEKGNGDGGASDISDPEKLFLYFWQHTPDLFNPLARIESPTEWDNYWQTAPPTCEQVKNAMNNFTADVKAGNIERRYIPHLPDRFVLGGWITKCQERLKKNSAAPPPDKRTIPMGLEA